MDEQQWLTQLNNARRMTLEKALDSNSWGALVEATYQTGQFLEGIEAGHHLLTLSPEPANWFRLSRHYEAIGMPSYALGCHSMAANGGILRWDHISRCFQMLGDEVRASTALLLGNFPGGVAKMDPNEVRREVTQRQLPGANYREIFRQLSDLTRSQFMVVAGETVVAVCQNRRVKNAYATAQMAVRGDPGGLTQQQLMALAFQPFVLRKGAELPPVPLEDLLKMEAELIQLSQDYNLTLKQPAPIRVFHSRTQGMMGVVAGSSKGTQMATVSASTIDDLAARTTVLQTGAGETILMIDIDGQGPVSVTVPPEVVQFQDANREPGRSLAIVYAAKEAARIRGIDSPF